MAGYSNETDYQSLAQALNDHYLVGDLKKMAKLICTKVPYQRIKRAKIITWTHPYCSISKEAGYQ